MINPKTKSGEIKTFILLSIGANLGERKENVKKALELLVESNVISMNSIRVSSLYETEPVGYKDQPWFVNAAVSGYTTLPLNNLIQLCKSIEYTLGRKSRSRWHERELDIDILLYGNELVDNPKITIPHPRMHERRFVLIPAAEIAGAAVHPKFGATVSELLKECEDSSVVKCC
jgi:2-amino-4-hydroxy-6-hydroxymethyldihydropteridine diphosphokinase